MSSILPPNWSWVKLGDLVKNPKDDIVDGPFGSNLKATEYKTSGIPIIRLQNIDRNYFVNKNIKYITKQKAAELKRHSYIPGDIIITKLGDPLGEACEIPKTFESGIIVADLVRVRLTDRKADKKFLIYSINSDYVSKQFKLKTKGTTRPRVNLTHVRSLEIKLPPLPEQKKIVEKIEELFSGLDSGVASLKKAKEQIRLYRQSVLASAFSGKLTQSAQHQAHSELPDGWKWVNIRDISDDMMIGIVKSSKEQFKDGRGVPYIKMNNVSIEGTVDTFDVVNVEVTKDELEKFHLKKDDILFNTRNSFELVGKTGILREERTPRVFNNNLLRIRVNKEFNPYFINYQMNSPEFRDKLKTGKRATTNICAIYQKDLFPMTLKIPPLKQQTQIVEEIEKRFSEADNLEKAIDESLAKSERLRQSILKKAFEGQLI